MTCCCHDVDEQECAQSKTESCLCRPYRDCYITTAQILSIVGLLMSWTWWVTLLLATPPMVALQVIWCCKMKKLGLYIVAMLCLVTSLGSLFAGMWMLIKWKDYEYCHVFTLTNQEIDSVQYVFDEYLDSFEVWYYPKSDFCREGVWAAVALMDFVIFGVAAMCTFHFARSRMANCEGQGAVTDIEVQQPGEKIQCETGITACCELDMAEAAAIPASNHGAAVASYSTAPGASYAQSDKDRVID